MIELGLMKGELVYNHHVHLVLCAFPYLIGVSLIPSTDGMIESVWARLSVFPAGK